MSGARTDLADARAVVERVAMAFSGEIGRLTDAKSVSELEHALSLLDAAGYSVEWRPRKRGSIAQIDETLRDALVLLRELEIGSDDSLDQAGDRVQSALQHLQWRATAPRSPVFEHVLDQAASAAGGARPLVEAIARVRHELPSGAEEHDAERRRATETAFAAAVRWLPALIASAGDEVAARALQDLADSQLSYLAEFLRVSSEGYPPEASAAVAEAAEALDGATRLRPGAPVEASLEVAGHAAHVMRRCVDRRLPASVGELRRLVEAASAWEELPARAM